MKWAASALICLFLGLAIWQGGRGFESELEYYRASRAFKDKDFDQARQLLETAIALDPDRAELHRALGNARHQWFRLHPGSRGAAQQAEKDFARASALDRLYSYHWYDRGQLALTMELAGIPPEIDAVACFYRALELDPWNKEILFGTILAYYRRGRISQADPYISRLLKVEILPEWFQRLASIRIQSDKDMDRFMELIGDNPELLDQYAIWLIRSRKRDLDRLKKMIGDSPEAKERRSQYLIRTEKKEQLAMDALEKALELTGEKGKIAIYSAYHYIAIGRPEIAIQRLTKMVERAPEDLGARYYLAEALLVQNQGREAKKQYQKLLELSPQSCLTYQGLARCAMNLKDYDEARIDYFRLLRCGGLSRQFKYDAALEFARAMERAGDRASQLAALREARGFAGDSDKEKIQFQIEKLEESIR